VCMDARLCLPACVCVSMFMSVSEQNRKQCDGVEEGAVGVCAGMICEHAMQHTAIQCCSMLQCGAGCCCVLQCVSACADNMQSVLCVAVSLCCSVLQCVAVCSCMLTRYVNMRCKR